MSLSIGLGGVNRHACAAVTDGRRVLGICEQERVTRVRGAGSNPTGVPDEALDAILTEARVRRSDITHCGLAEAAGVNGPWTTVMVDHHHAPACAAYLTSPFNDAAVVICDHERTGVSIWRGRETDLAPVECRWSGPHLSDLYTECAWLLGFASQAGDERFEALARMMAADPEDRVPSLFTFDGTGIREAENWRGLVADRATAAASDVAGRARRLPRCRTRLPRCWSRFSRRCATRRARSGCAWVVASSIIRRSTAPSGSRACSSVYSFQPIQGTPDCRCRPAISNVRSD